MLYRNLGNTGVEVSQVCIGTMTFGEQLEKQGVYDALSYALEKGINFIDAANIYPRSCPGESERIIGEALAGMRERVVLATKVGGPMEPGINTMGLNRINVMNAVDGCLKRLRTDYIDVLYLHFPDGKTTAEELVYTMNLLIQSGKIRYYGLSNFPAWKVCQITMFAKNHGMQPPVVYEGVYNLLTRGVEDELMPCLKEMGQNMVCFNPLAGGLLTGKYTEGKKLPNTRFSLEKGYSDRYWGEENLESARELEKIAKDCGISLLELSFGWILKQAGVCSVITGFSKKEQLIHNVKAIESVEGLTLPDKEIDRVWNHLKGTRFSYHK